MANEQKIIKRRKNCVHFIRGLRSAFAKPIDVYEDNDVLELFSMLSLGLLKRVEIAPEEISRVFAVTASLPLEYEDNILHALGKMNNFRHDMSGTLFSGGTLAGAQIIQYATNLSRYKTSGALLLAGGECVSDLPVVYSKKARKFMLKFAKAKTPAAKINIFKSFSASAWVPKIPQSIHPITREPMYISAEEVAQSYKISRLEQDNWALLSHERARMAQLRGDVKELILPLISQNTDQFISEDLLVRYDQTLAQLNAISPRLNYKLSTISSGNSSPYADGVSVGILCSAKESSLLTKSSIRILDIEEISSFDKKNGSLSEARAISRLLKRYELALSDIDYFEIHEGFSAQILTLQRIFQSQDLCQTYLGLTSAKGELDLDKLNTMGGSIALGHPPSATAIRLLSNMAYLLIKNTKRWGIVSISDLNHKAIAFLIENGDC